MNPNQLQGFCENLQNTNEEQEVNIYLMENLSNSKEIYYQQERNESDSCKFLPFSYLN